MVHEYKGRQRTFQKETTMKFKRTALAVATLLLAILLAACGTKEPNQPPAESASLPGTEWALTLLNGDALIDGTQITLRFGDGSLEGSGGCNTYGGSYTASGDSLRLSDLYWTEMACMEPEGVMDQELAYLNTLNTVALYRVNVDLLELYKEAGTPVLVFSPRGAEPPGSAESTSDGAGSQAPQGSPLIATLAVPESLPSGDVVEVNVTLTNTSSEGLYLLKWFTPLEGLAGDIFRVRRDGMSLPYHGIQVKRGVPTPDGYVWIDAGASVSAQVDLAEGYDFDQAGEYTIDLRSPRLSHIAATTEDQATTFEELDTIEIPSNTVTVTIEQ